jgi:hypothetical protein
VEPALVQPIGSNGSDISEPVPTAADIQPDHVAPHSNGSAAAQPGNNLEQAVNGAEATPPGPKIRPSIPSITKLEFALRTAIAAAAGAEQFGHEIGYVVRFAPDDIRAMAITVLINGSRENGGQR